MGLVGTISSGQADVSLIPDQAFADKISDAASATRAALSATYAPSDAVRRALTRWWHRCNSIQVSRVLFCGDSITEGTRGTDAPWLRWVDHVATGLRRAGNPEGVPGGIYIFSHGFYETRVPANWTYTGTTVEEDDTGPGYWNVEMSAAATATLTIEGTGFRVLWTRRTDGGTLAVTIDGVSVASIDTNGTFNAGMATDYTGLTPGTHTIVLTASGTVCDLQGAYVYYGDESSGHRIYVAGHGGIESSAMTRANYGAWFGQTAPDLITLFYGVNDYRNNVTVASFKANLEAGVDTARAARPDALIAIISGYEALHASTPVAPWANYKTAMAEVAAAKGCLLIDLTPAFGSGVIATSTGLMDADQVHPIDAGHRLIAQTVLSALIEPGANPIPQEKVWIPSNAFILNGGTPTLSAVNNTYTAWDLDKDAVESVLANISVPLGWRTFAADLWWVNRGAGAGAVRVRAIVSEMSSGLAARSVADTQVTATAGAQHIPFRTVSHLPSLRVDPGSLMRLMVSRVATDAGDTLANDVGLMGVMLRRLV